MAKTMETTQTVTMPEADRQLEQLNIALQDMAYCQVDIIDMIFQGERGLLSTKRGNIVAGLEKAAYRVRWGTLSGFDHNPARPMSDEERAAEIAADQARLAALAPKALEEEPPAPEAA